MRHLPATFIGIGAQKCASTWLYGALQQRPEVTMSEVKEVDFFSYYFDRGYEWYERNFENDANSEHRGEISPSYFVHPNAAARAATYNKDLKIFVTLRDPVARIYSNHLHEVRKGHVSGSNLVFENAMGNNPLYREQGHYAAHLTRWFEHFPRKNIHVFFQEDINADSAGMAQQVSDALGLATTENFLDLRANESVRYRNAIVGEALWKMGNFARKNDMGHLVEGVKSLPGIRQMRAKNRESIRDVVEPMLQDTETELTQYYAEDVTKLEDLLERPVPWQRFQKVT